MANMPDITHQQLNHHLKSIQCPPAILKAPDHISTAPIATSSNLTTTDTSLTATSPKRDQTTIIDAAPTTTTVDDYPRPTKELEKILKKTAIKAARKGYQLNYIKTGQTLEPASDIEARHAAIIDRAIKDAIAADTTTEQHDARLLEMRRAWSREKTGLFPEQVSTTFEVVRTHLEARDAKGVRVTAPNPSNKVLEHEGVKEMGKKRDEGKDREETRGEKESVGTIEIEVQKKEESKEEGRKKKNKKRKEKGKQENKEVRTVPDNANNAKSSPTPISIDPGALLKPTTTPSNGDVALTPVQTADEEGKREVRINKPGDADSVRTRAPSTSTTQTPVASAKPRPSRPPPPLVSIHPASTPPNDPAVPVKPTTTSFSGDVARTTVRAARNQRVSDTGKRETRGTNEVRTTSANANDNAPRRTRTPNGVNSLPPRTPNASERVSGSNVPIPPVNTKPTPAPSNDPTPPINCTTGTPIDPQPTAHPLVSTAPNADADELSRVDRNSAVPANTPVVVTTPPTPVNAIHVTSGEPDPKPSPAYDKPLVPAVAALKANTSLSNIDTQLSLMEHDWRATRTEPFPVSIRSTFAQLRAAVEMRDIEIVQTALPTWGVQVAKERTGSNEKEETEETRKKGIMEKIVAEARKADEDPTYGEPAPLDWAEDVEATIEPTPIASVVPAAEAPRDFSALRSGTRNPWASLNHRRRRSCPQPQHFTRQSFPPRQHDNYVQSQPTPQSSHIPSPVVETIRHPRGISPAKPVVKTTSPVHSVTSTPFMSPSPSIPPTHPVLIVRCHCGSSIPVHHPFLAGPQFGRRPWFGFRRPPHHLMRPGRSHRKGGEHVAGRSEWRWSWQ
jgi:hypothetical protein